MTKLDDAAFNGDVETATKLIETYSKLKNKIELFAKPLSSAALMGHVEIVRLFVNAGADINYIREEGTALHYAVRGTGMPAHLIGENLHNAEVANILIKAGTNLFLTDDPKSSNYKGWTALMAAACYGRVTIAKMLIDAGAQIDGRDKNDRTPLTIAADFGSVAVAELLIEAGADINAKDSKGLTAFDYVAGDIDAIPSDLEEELRPMQALGQFSAKQMGDNRTTMPPFVDLVADTEGLERARRGAIARMLRNAGASDR